MQMEATGHLDFWGRGGSRSADWEAIITYVIDGFMGMGSWGRTLTHCSCAEACFRSLQLLTKAPHPLAAVAASPGSPADLAGAILTYVYPS